MGEVKAVQPLKVRFPNGVSFDAELVTSVVKTSDADLVVITQSESERIDASGKPIYVIQDRESPGSWESLWKIPGVVGCSVASGCGLPDDLKRLIENMKDRRQKEALEQKSDPVDRWLKESPAKAPDSGFVTLTLGRMARFMGELAQALQSVRSQREEWKLKPSPLFGISASEWLDVMHAFLVPPSEEELARIIAMRKRIFRAITGAPREKAKLSDEDERQIGEAFGEAFGWTEREIESVCGDSGLRKKEVEAAKSRSNRPIPRLLIEGETGTGKTLLSTMIAQWFGNIPYSQVTCSNLSEHLLESELFGALGGSYTDHRTTTTGAVLSAYAGVLFLDEIGDVPIAVQAKLLALLNDGLIHPTGWSGPPLRVPVVVIAATNQNLRRKIRDRKFREDLYYRFQDKLFIPPLRQRMGDLERLTAMLLANPSINPGRRITAVSAQAVDVLKGYPFPGNFRELETILRSATRQARRTGGTIILSEDLCFEAAPLDTSTAAFALPIQHWDGKRRSVVLAWNPNWATYHFIGGRQDPEDQGDAWNTARREVEKKTQITLNPDDIQPIARVLETSQISGGKRYSSDRRWYRFHFFKVIAPKKLDEFIALASSEPHDNPIPQFVVASDDDIDKGFVRNRPISEAVRECWERLEALGLL